MNKTIVASMVCLLVGCSTQRPIVVPVTQAPAAQVSRPGFEEAVVNNHSDVAIIRVDFESVIGTNDGKYLPSPKSLVWLIAPKRKLDAGDYIAKLEREMAEKLLVTRSQRKEAKGSVRFGVNSAVPEGLVELADVLALARTTGAAISITGHTDDTGSGPYNDQLGTVRAMAVASWLAANGVARSQMLISSRGEVFPVADNATEDGRERNRRAEAIVTVEVMQ